MELKFIAMETILANQFRNDGLDAYGQVPKRAISDGKGNPCRHCLKDIPQGAGMLIIAHMPFKSKHPYAETGPVLLCSEECEPYGSRGTMPEVISGRQEFILRGYSSEELIVEGTGRVILTGKLVSYASELLDIPSVTSVHVRSASNNCYFCKIEKGGD
ncbi:MAG: DUF1203 domain-containing protein [Salaquimonas sp.]